MRALLISNLKQSSRAALLVAHAGHELMLYGWLRRVKPFVCVLTDGSGHSGESRMPHTSELLAAVGAGEGPVFGRFTDRELYSVIMDGRAEVLGSLVAELAEFFTRNQIETVVTDAMEGFNPVHDLCRMLAGAACEIAGVPRLYEYPIHAGPRAYDELPNATVEILDELTLARKLAAAHAMSGAIPDIADMLVQWSEAAFSREAFRSVEDWRARGWPADERPYYEAVGEERVSTGRYDRVIRYHEHFVPLLEAFRSRVSQCAF